MLTDGSRFCGDCGNVVPVPGEAHSTTEKVADATAPQQALSAQPADPPAAPIKSDRSPPWRWIAAAVVVVALVGAGGAVALSGGGDPEPAVAAEPQVTTTTVDPKVVTAVQELTAYVQSIENVLGQSAQGRGQVGDVVGGVQSCRFDPYEAGQRIRSVVANRTSILNQLAGFAAAPTPEAQNVHSLLQQAIQSSIEADIHYQQWMDFLYADYYYYFPVGCPGGTAPTDNEFFAAQADDQNSTNLKNQFVAAYNALATPLGLRAWSASEF